MKPCECCGKPTPIRWQCNGMMVCQHCFAKQHAKDTYCEDWINDGLATMIKTMKDVQRETNCLTVNRECNTKEAQA